MTTIPGTRRGSTAKKTTDGGSERPFERNLSYRLSFTTFLMNRATSPILAAHGISNQQWKVLSVLRYVEPATAQQVTQWVTLDKSAISRTVRSLLELGLLTRKLQSEDARNVHMSLTAKGRAVYQRISTQFSALQAELVADVPTEELTAFLGLLRKIERGLSARLQREGQEDLRSDLSDAP